MKTKAIIRIVVCSVLFLSLLGVLLGGLHFVHFFGTKPSGETTYLERKVDAERYTNLEIDWAAGSITIVKGIISDSIIIQEVRDTNNPYTFSTEFDDNTLKISYGEPSINFGNISGKDLLIQVPSYWDCNQLEINGAALNIEIRGVDIDHMELNGASNKLQFNGELHDLEVNGMANVMDINISKGLGRVSVEGMGCKLNLKLPSSVGFDASLDGLGVSFESSLECFHDDNSYSYGNKACKIDVSGLGCKVSVDPS